MGLTSSNNQQGPPASKRRMTFANNANTQLVENYYPPLQSLNVPSNAFPNYTAPPSSDPLKPPRLSSRDRSYYCFHIDLSQEYQFIIPSLHRYVISYGARCSQFLDINVTHIISDKSRNVIEASGLVAKFGTKILSLHYFLLKLIDSYERILPENLPLNVDESFIMANSSRPPLSPVLRRAAQESLTMIQSGTKTRPPPDLGQLLAEERYSRMGPAASALSGPTCGAPSNIAGGNPNYPMHHHHQGGGNGSITPSSRPLFNGGGPSVTAHEYSKKASTALMRQKILNQQHFEDIQMQSYLQRVAYNTSSLKPASNIRLDASAVCSPHINAANRTSALKRRNPSFEDIPNTTNSTIIGSSKNLLGIHMGKNVTFETFTHPFVLLEEITNNYSSVYREYPPSIITNSKSETILRPSYPILHLRTMELHCPWVTSLRFNIRHEDAILTKVTIQAHEEGDLLNWKPPLIPSHANMFNIEPNVKWDRKEYNRTWELLTFKAKENRKKRSFFKVVEPLNLGLAPIPILHPLSLPPPQQQQQQQQQQPQQQQSVLPDGNVRPRPGFCECCFEKYSNLEQHVSSESHRKLVVSKDFYRLVDSVINSLVRIDAMPPNSPTSPCIATSGDSSHHDSAFVKSSGSIPLRNITNTNYFNDSNNHKGSVRLSKVADPDDEDVFGGQVSYNGEKNLNNDEDDGEGDNMMRVGGGSRTPILSSPSLKRRRSHRNIVGGGGGGGGGGVTVDSFIMNIPQL